MSFWKDLRERRIAQILGAYLAAGWIVLGAADQLVDRAILPDLVYPLLLVLYLVGIPAALAIGWFHGERGDQSVTRLELAILVALGVVSLGAGAVVIDRHREAVAAPAALAGSSLDLRRIAVLYFEDASRGGELEYLAAGLTEGLIDRLSGVGPLDVISANGVRPLIGSDIGRDSVARLLGAGILIDGSVESTGAGLLGEGMSQIRVTTRMIDGESGALLERTAIELPLGEVLTAQDTIAEALADRLRLWLGEEFRLRERRTETSSAAAWALLQRAMRAGRQAEAAGTGPERAGAMQRADSLLARAEAVDPGWVRPVVERGWIAYRRSRTAHDPEIAGSAIAAGMAHTARALALDPNHAAALELRGTLRYWTYLLHLTPDPAERGQLLRDARADLERSVRVDPARASAHATLSHLYYQIGDPSSVVLAARRAYEQDAWLADASQVLWRLFLAHYDLAQFRQAEGWCEIGRGRFADDPNFSLCRLYLLGSPFLPPDVRAAWSHLAAADSLIPPGDPRRNLARVLTAAVIGRAGLPDSADHVLRRARLGTASELDPNLELFAYEAFARTRFSDFDGAIELLKRYVAANHGFERGGARHWWWEELRTDPRYRELVVE